MGVSLEQALRNVIASGCSLRDTEVSGYLESNPKVVAYWIVNFDPVFDAQKNIIGVNGVVNDISERKRMEKRLRATSERLSLATQSGNIGVWEYNLETERMVWDQRVYEIYGIDPMTANIDFKQWRSYLHPDDQDRAVAEVMAAINGEIDLDSEFRIITSNGELRHVKGSGIAECDEMGNAVCMIGVNIDISDFKRVEQQLEELIVLNQKIINECPVGIVVYRASGECVAINQAYAGILGEAVDDIMRKNFRNLDSWRSAGLLEQAIQALGSNSNIQTTAHHTADSGREIWVDVHFLPFLLGGEPHLMCIKSDVTTWHLAEVALNEAKLEAEKTSRAKSEFLATMSHEIRTPMNGILGMLKLLQHTQLTPRQIDYAQKAEGATQALLSIINDILDFSKVEAGRLELDEHPFVIGDLLRELSVILSANLGFKNVEILFEVATDVPPVLVGDSLRLRQILINLAGNALKFTEQGEVVLSIRLLKRDVEQVELEFSIRDTGIGIPADKLDYIFEGFSQAASSTSRRFGGTGLGLAISQRLVVLMGSTLDVESEFGRGSRFFFSLCLGVRPALGATASTPNQLQAEACPLQTLLIPGTAGLRVLVVDDNALSRKILMEMAIAIGWQVECSVSGEAALVYLEQPDAPHYDIVLMDWRMPGMDGWETTRKIRQFEHGGQAPVVIMVTAASRELLTKKSTLETNLIDGYLVKPITASMLYEAVAEAIVECKGENIRQSVVHAREQLAGLRLLVVEDNRLNRQVAQELLERCGAQITIAVGGHEGIEEAVAADPPFDAILMDVQMPGIDGLEATRRLRAVPRMHSVPIIAMTANAMEADKEICLSVGMVDHVCKPIDLNTLITTVLRHTRGSADDAVAPAPTFEALSQPVPNIPTPILAMDASFVDVDSAIKRMGCSRDFYEKVVLGFRSDAALLVAELQRFITMKDHAQAMRAAHTLRGLADTVGAGALSAQAEQIETTLRKMHSDTSNLNFAGLEDMSTYLATQFVYVLAALPQPLPPSLTVYSEHEVAGLLDRVTFSTKLQELRSSLELRDMQASKLGEQLRQRFGSMLDKDQLDQLLALEHALGRLDFTSAIDACDALSSGFQ